MVVAVVVRIGIGVTMWTSGVMRRIVERRGRGGRRIEGVWVSVGRRVEQRVDGHSTLAGRSFHVDCRQNEDG